MGSIWPPIILAKQFQAAGLKTSLYDGSPFQKFQLTIGAKLGPDDRNRLDLQSPAAEGKPSQRTKLKLGVDFSPLGLGGSGKFDLELAFAGFGITAKNEKYDDYAGLDVKGKAVIVLRHQPQRGNPHGLFGSHDAPYAALSRKVSNAYEHGAAAIIFCTDDEEIHRSVARSQALWQKSVDALATADADFKKLEHPTLERIAAHAQRIDELAEQVVNRGKQLMSEFDPVMGFERGGDEGESREFPVLHCRRTALDPAVKAALGEDLAALEHKIDADAKPHGQVLTGWKIAGETNVLRQQVAAKNVVGVLDAAPGAIDAIEGETIVIGAHYDHLGYGGMGSAAPGVHAIHHGADDNGSGAAALVEVARQLAANDNKRPRRIVFIAFTGEERGLLGSARYVRDPLVPLDKTIAMLNMDMVGRLKDDKLIVYATDTSPAFDPIIDRINKKFKFKITRQPGGFGPSDHASFYGRNIPVLHFFTGTHADYHRPTDTADKLNVPGMRRVAQMVTECALALETAERPAFVESKVSSVTLDAPKSDRPYFGSIPDFGQEQPGYGLSGVSKGSPAESAGLKAGDVIVGLGESKIGNLEDFDSALRKHTAGEKVPVTIKRGHDEMKLEVTLGPPR